MLGSFPHLGPSLVLPLGKGCALLSLLTSASAVPRMPQKEAEVVTVYCSALFLEPWRLGKAAGAAAYVLQGKRRLSGRLKVFFDLTAEGGANRLPAPSMVDSKLRVLAGSGHALFSWLHIPPLACSQQLIKQQMSAAVLAPGSFPFILFYPTLRGMPLILSTVC